MTVGGRSSVVNVECIFLSGKHSNDGKKKKHGGEYRLCLSLSEAQ